MTVTEATLEQQITAAFREATAKFQKDAAVLNHLNARWAITKQQLGSVANHIDNMTTPPLQREAMVAARDRTLQDALVFFSGWRATPVEGGAALLYSQKLPPAPAPQSQEELFDGRLSVLRKQRGIVLKTNGNRLSAYPASKLTADDRDFLTTNKAKVHAKILAEEDTWLL